MFINKKLNSIFIITWLITKRQALGFGDIQLTLVLGFWFGDFRILLVIFLSAMIALIYWIVLSIFDKFDNNRALPIKLLCKYIHPFFFNLYHAECTILAYHII